MVKVLLFAALTLFVLLPDIRPITSTGKARYRLEKYPSKAIPLP